jgi:hypothetical protein
MSEKWYLRNGCGWRWRGPWSTQWEVQAVCDQESQIMGQTYDAGQLVALELWDRVEPIGWELRERFLP